MNLKKTHWRCSRLPAVLLSLPADGITQGQPGIEGATSLFVSD